MSTTASVSHTAKQTRFAEDQTANNAVHPREGIFSLADAFLSGHTTHHGAEYSSGAEYTHAPLPITSTTETQTCSSPEHNHKSCSPAPAYQPLYRDELLFTSTPSSALPTIDVDTDKFFEDADACIYSPTSSALSASATEHERAALFFSAHLNSGDEAVDLEMASDDDDDDDDIVHLDFSDIHAHLNAYDVQSQEGYVSEDGQGEVEREQREMLGYWEWDYQRHERVAVEAQRL